MLLQHRLGKTQKRWLLGILESPFGVLDQEIPPELERTGSWEWALQNLKLHRAWCLLVQPSRSLLHFNCEVMLCVTFPGETWDTSVPSRKGTEGRLELCSAGDPWICRGYLLTGTGMTQRRSEKSTSKWVTTLEGCNWERPACLVRKCQSPPAQPGRVSPSPSGVCCIQNLGEGAPWILLSFISRGQWSAFASWVSWASLQDRKAGLLCPPEPSTFVCFVLV